MRRPPSPRLRAGLTDRTDAYLLRLAREGDPRAYEAIVARYREPLRRSCARIVPERSEDAVQQALLSAWVAIERGADVRELRPWLYSIARNAAIDQARGVRAELVELGPEVPGGEDPAHAEARRREVSEVLEAVAALPERQRQALVDTALHGRATEAVAVDLGLSGGALRQLVHRARTTVRAAVPSVAFPVPGWLAELLSEEGSRRGAVLLSSGSGAAILAKATATVATVGAVVAGGLSAHHVAVAARHAQAAPAQRAAASANRGASGSTGVTATVPESRGQLLTTASVLQAATLPGGTHAHGGTWSDAQGGTPPHTINVADHSGHGARHPALDGAQGSGMSSRPELSAATGSRGPGSHEDGRGRGAATSGARDGDDHRDRRAGGSGSSGGGASGNESTTSSYPTGTSGDRDHDGDGSTPGGSYPSRTDSPTSGDPQERDGSGPSSGDGSSGGGDVPSHDRPAATTDRDNSADGSSPE